MMLPTVSSPAIGRPSLRCVIGCEVPGKPRVSGQQPRQVRQELAPGAAPTGKLQPVLRREVGDDQSPTVEQVRYREPFAARFFDEPFGEVVVFVEAGEGVALSDSVLGCGVVVLAPIEGASASGVSPDSHTRSAASRPMRKSTRHVSAARDSASSGTPSVSIWP